MSLSRETDILTPQELQDKRGEVKQADLTELKTWIKYISALSDVLVRAPETSLTASGFVSGRWKEGTMGPDVGS